MKVESLQPEPELEFGNRGTCADIRFGIGHFNVFDLADPEGPRQIKVGIVGTDETLSGLTDWLETCRFEIQAKQSNQPRLYPPFPGFAVNHSFHSKLLWNASEFRRVNIPPEVTGIANYNRLLETVADLYVQEIDQVIEKSGAAVVLCALPLQHLRLVTHTSSEEEQEQEEVAEASAENKTVDIEGEEDAHVTYDFHDLLKAKSLHLRTPLQVVLPATYDKTKNAAQKQLLNRDQQDEATRAWNLFTALYYKARGVPWRMTRDEADVRTCYLGVSFFRTLDKKRIYASSAQVFNERGQGVIVRGGVAYEDKEDRQVHLDREGAYNLLSLALQAFRDEHYHYPARVVIHKTSSFTEDESNGFTELLREKGIELMDFLYLRQSLTRLFRASKYPPIAWDTLAFGRPPRHSLHARKCSIL